MTATFICSGQTLFFDNLKNSVWISKESYTGSTIKSAKEISLTKHLTTDSLKVDATLWFFGDVLQLRLFSARGRCVSDVSTHRYIIDKNNGTLKIFLDDKSVLTYKVGIVSTGKQALLIRQ